MAADLNLRWNDTTYGYTNDLLKATVGTDYATLGIDLCKPYLQWGQGIRAICGIGTKNTVVVRTQRPITNREATPFPNSEKPEGDYVDTTWEFDGPMPPITVTVDAPAAVMAKSWLYWSLPGYSECRSTPRRVSTWTTSPTPARSGWRCSDGRGVAAR